MSHSTALRKLARQVSYRLEGLPALHGLLRRGFISLPVSWRGKLIVHDALKDLSDRQNSVFFIQVGANDGSQNDPLRYFVEKKAWQGVLVEPVPFYHDRLRENYQGREGLRFERVAISDSNQSRKFWYLEDWDGKLPDWARGLGSFFREEVISASVPGMDLKPYLREIEVPCVSLQQLLQEEERPVDALIIDAQGYDGELVKQIDFNEMKPSVIVFEHILLDLEEKDECRSILRDEGYRLQEDQWDVVAELIPIV